MGVRFLAANPSKMFISRNSLDQRCKRREKDRGSLSAPAALTTINSSKSRGKESSNSSNNSSSWRTKRRESGNESGKESDYTGKEKERRLLLKSRPKRRWSKESAPCQRLKSWRNCVSLPALNAKSAVSHILCV